mgnify:CR=1 FL=1
MADIWLLQKTTDWFKAQEPKQKAFTNGGKVRPIGLKFGWVNAMVVGSVSKPKPATQEPPRAPPRADSKSRG